MRNDHIPKLREMLTVSAWLYVPAFILLAVTAAMSYKFDIPISKFMRDPAAIMEAHPLNGVISNIGILLWSATAAICLFCWVLLLRTRKHSETRWFFFSGGILTSVLLLDDLFLLHERLYPMYFGITDKIILPLYSLLLLSFIIGFKRQILKTRFYLLFFAICFFGVSLLVDRLPESLLPWHHLFEDGSKFFGIVSWFGYFITSGFQEAGSLFGSGRSD